MNGLSDEKGMKLVEKAKSKMVGTNSCWQNAYQHLFAGCSQILAVEEKRWRFAWHLSDCFQKDSGRPAFPYCDTKSPMVNCLKMLNDNEHKDGMSMLHDAYTNLGQEVDNVRNEVVEIEKQISVVGDTLSSKMQTLQTSADDIENMAGKSLDKQKQLLDGQSNALKGLQLLTQFQSKR
ncbi:hypothetical protein OIU84_028277 [Salix udensis]|uniref:Uncharacterized protein n=1 Tax=Salix udensis TaxID=889485 RepID=A0AAD6P8F1_9ROSI|nr:hypothetical protein OIU84_028277 [Salix udensis]